jgi:cation-transporting ATPase 13A1
VDKKCNLNIWIPQKSELIDCSNVVQGAPETLRGMLARVPEDYDQNYLTMSRRGARVLALGWRDLGPLSHQELKVHATGWLPECYVKFLSGFL